MVDAAIEQPVISGALICKPNWYGRACEIGVIIVLRTDVCTHLGIAGPRSQIVAKTRSPSVAAPMILKRWSAGTASQRRFTSLQQNTLSKKASADRHQPVLEHRS